MESGWGREQLVAQVSEGWVRDGMSADLIGLASIGCVCLPSLFPSDQCLMGFSRRVQIHCFLFLGDGEGLFPQSTRLHFISYLPPKSHLSLLPSPITPPKYTIYHLTHHSPPPPSSPRSLHTKVPPPPQQTTPSRVINSPLNSFSITWPTYDFAQISFGIALINAIDQSAGASPLPATTTIATAVAV